MLQISATIKTFVIRVGTEHIPVMVTHERALKRGALLGGMLVFGAGIVAETVHYVGSAALHPGDDKGMLTVLLEGLVGAVFVVYALWRMYVEGKQLREQPPLQMPDRPITPA